MMTRVAFVVVALMMMGSMAHGGQYFLSPNGDDGAAGTRAAPWQTLEKASEAAQAGDTVTLLAGRYPGTLQPAESGTAEAPIVFRADERLRSTLTGFDGDGGAAVILDGISHVRLEGLHVVPETPRTGWIFMRDCSHIAVEDCRMEDSTGPTPLRIDRCDHVWLRNNVIHRHAGGNMIVNNNNTRMVFEGNAISRTGHCPFQLTGNRYVVVRGNVIHAAWGRPFADRSTEDMLFEHNIVTHAYNSGRSASSNAKFVTTRSLFRFNRVFRNIGGPINLYPFNPGGNSEQPNPLLHIRLYHNVFDDNAQYGIGFAGSSHDQTEDVVFANNIFSRNDPHGSQRQINLRGGTVEQARLVRNVFAGMQPGLPVVHDYGGAFSVEELQTEAFQTEHGARYEENLDVDPGFVDAGIYNHALATDSPLRDAGAPLTHATAAGDGTLLPVADAHCFYDGFGIEGEQGDLIAVGTPDRRARVVEVDRDAGTLLLDRELTWEVGDAVSLPWSGAAPDIGAYEHGPGGRMNVQVVAEPFEARPGDEVTLRAVVRGSASARQIDWWLGDGTTAEGREIKHSYDEEYDYAIRVRVIDEDGEVHRGAGYVIIAELVDPSEPLIHTTWDAGDETAWWLWKSYRPRPAAYRDVVESGAWRGPTAAGIPEGYDPPGDGVNYRHVMAPRDGGHLPTQLHPAGWDIDRYPRVSIRYRVGEGTPISIILVPFSGPAVTVAASPAAEVNSDSRVTDHVLQDDEQWRELEFDARVIRELNAEVQVLQGIRVGAAPREEVTEGDWYDLDEVIIGP